MSKFFLEDERERITFNDGEWAEVKQELTQADSDYILNQMAKGGATGTDGKSSARIDVQLGRMPLLERAIVAWSFTDDSGKPVPVNTETISKLRAKYRNIILKKVDEINQSANEFQKK
jgi:hypothetical protein